MKVSKLKLWWLRFQVGCFPKFFVAKYPEGETFATNGCKQLLTTVVINNRLCSAYFPNAAKVIKRRTAAEKREEYAWAYGGTADLERKREAFVKVYGGAVDFSNLNKLNTCREQSKPEIQQLPYGGKNETLV